MFNKICLIVLSVFLLSGCTRFPENHVAITNSESPDYLYVNKKYIIADNATHIAFSIPKSDKGVWIKYSSQWKD